MANARYEDYLWNLCKKVRGGKITGLESNEDGFPVIYVEIVEHGHVREKGIVITQDPEGNGPGHLSVERYED